MGFTPSPFLHPGSSSQAGSLAVLHLRRDHLLPTVLCEVEEDAPGDGVGPVSNTRFGSYPHSTLLGQAWGTQVLASKIDTGSRGRTNKKKRKVDETRGREDGGDDDEDDEAGASKKIKVDGDAAPHSLKKSVAEKEGDSVRPQPSPQSRGAAQPTGFCHILPPTPESWTLSLPHRTQILYTPDYSYILQKIRARPGSVLIEAGAGSGSFTHAAARAVFNGYFDSPDSASDDARPNARRLKPKRRQGKVYSFEYHSPRAEQLRAEIDAHGLSSIVHITHSDVYEQGFVLETPSPNTNGDTRPSLPQATTIFLDLPAPWLALPHLTRRHPSPLDPTSTVYICIFLPCIEQVQQAVAALRTHGWLEISMQELAQRRIEIRREHVGLELQGLRNVNATPSSVEEAVERLVEVEKNGRRYQNMMAERARRQKEGLGEERKGDQIVDNAGAGDERGPAMASSTKKSERLARNADANVGKLFKEGRLVHRTEPEIRTHTSYLIFAVLPREWTDEDEARCRKRWPAETTSETKE